MEIKDFSSMEIEGMDKDNLLKEYVELKKATDRIKLDMDLMKDKILELLEKDNETKFTNSFGEVSIMNHTKNQFVIGLAKKILTENQIEDCTEEKEIKYLKILSTEAKNSAMF